VKLKTCAISFKASTIAEDMNTDLIVDKHPFTTRELLLMMVGGMLLAYGIAYLILRNRK